MLTLSLRYTNKYNAQYNLVLPHALHIQSHIISHRVIFHQVSPPQDSHLHKQEEHRYIQDVNSPLQLYEPHLHLYVIVPNWLRNAVNDLNCCKIWFNYYYKVIDFFFVSFFEYNCIPSVKRTVFDTYSGCILAWCSVIFACRKPEQRVQFSSRLEFSD